MKFTEEKFASLAIKTQGVLTTLCSNYRGDMLVTAEFRCLTFYGAGKFIKDIRKSLNELKRKKYVTSFYFGEVDTDEENDMCYFMTTAQMNMPVEDMAKVSVNSQTIFMG